MNKYLNKINSADWPKHINFIVDVYNDLPHSSLNYNSPTDIFLNENYKKYAINKHIENIDYNIDKSNEQNIFNVGDYVRILQKKNIFDKEDIKY